MAKKQDDEKQFKANTPAKRFFKLAGMSASITTNVAGQRIAGLFKSEEKKKQDQEKLYANIGKQIAETLGEMKGAVMKVGQIASQMKDMLPDEVASALEILQKSSPPLPYSVIRSQLIKALGDAPENLFAEFNVTPFAAASIGQVHRAKTKTGLDVVVKIQYPGVKESCDSDLKHLRRLFKLAGLVKVPQAAMDATFDEIRRTLHEELDYVNEAKNLEFFCSHYQDNPQIIIPAPVKELSSETVLTLEYVEGDPLSEIKPPRYKQETIDNLATLIFETMTKQVYELQLVHSDPHPGNFAFRPDGSFIMYDFGAVKKTTPELINKLYALVDDILLKGKVETLDNHLINIGVRQTESKPPSDEYYRGWLDIALAPFKSNQVFDFGTSNIHKRIAEKIRNEELPDMGVFQPSADMLYINRVLSGHYWTMVELGAKISLRPLVERIVQNRPQTA